MWLSEGGRDRENSQGPKEWYSTHTSTALVLQYPLNNTHVPACFSIKTSMWGFTFIWPCIVTNLFTINTNRCINFHIYSGMKLYMFRAVSLPILRSYPLYIRHWHVLYRFDERLHAGGPQNCITRASAECTVDNSWGWAEKLPETCRVSYQNKFEN